LLAVVVAVVVAVACCWFEANTFPRASRKQRSRCQRHCCPADVWQNNQRWRKERAKNIMLSALAACPYKVKEAAATCV